MYERIGKKIKGLAIAIFIIEAIAAVLYGFGFMLSDRDPIMILFGFLIIAGGILIAWISSWLLYGFGELIDKICDIERNTRNGKNLSDTQMKEASKKNYQMEQLRSQGLISEEEYQQIISKEE